MSFRFWNFSPKAPEDYQTILRKTVLTYDNANDAITYTPPIAAGLGTIFGIVNTTLSYLNEQPAQASISDIVLAIAAINSVILLVSKRISSQTYTAAETLITTGIQSGFFNTPPSFPNVPAASHNTVADIETGSTETNTEPNNLNEIFLSATKERILYRR